MAPSPDPVLTLWGCVSSRRGGEEPRPACRKHKLQHHSSCLIGHQGWSQRRRGPKGGVLGEGKTAQLGRPAVGCCPAQGSAFSWGLKLVAVC